MASDDTKKKIAVALTIFVVILASVSVYFLFIQQPSEDKAPESKEVVGYWNGMYHDEEIDSAKNNSVPKEDLDKVKNRAIARLEVIRDEPMKEDVEVEIRTREEFKKQNPFQYETSLYTKWSNVVWFGQLIVPGQVDVQNVRNDLRGNQTLAYYLIREDKLVLIVKEDEEGYVRVDESALIHELTHAMQDQRMGLEGEKLHSKVTTVRQSQLSLVEGESRLVEDLYSDRCGEEWSCFSYQTNYNEPKYDLPGYQAISLAPYDAGEKYMTMKYNQGGWEAVDNTYTDNPPVTMAEIIYPKQDHNIKYVKVQDISQGSWDPYALQGTNGQDHLGMANLSAMLYHYESKYMIQTGVEGVNNVRQVSTGGYQYQTSLTEQLKYDGMLPYRTPGEQTGFVWTQVWKSDESADQFTNVYGRILTGMGGEEIKEPEYRLKGDAYNEHTVYSGPTEFQGYFSVARNENMVVITYSENKSGLGALRPARSEPLAIKNYETGTYDRPTYEITPAGSAEEVSDSNEGLDIGDYLTLIVFFISAILWIIFSSKATKR